MATVTVKLPAELYSAIAAALYNRAHVAGSRAYTPRMNASPAMVERFKAEAKAAHAEYMAFTKPDNLTRA